MSASDTFVMDGKEVRVFGSQYMFVNDNGEIDGGLDWNGQRYNAGDWVLYAVGAGQGQMMAYGQVQQVILRPAKWGGDSTFEFKVQVRTYRTSGNWDNKKRTRPAYVNPMNITKLAEDQRDILDYGLVQAGIDKND